MVREKIKIEKCAGCGGVGKEFIRAHIVCKNCASILKKDNDMMHGKKEIPKDLKLHFHRLSKDQWRIHEKYIDKHMSEEFLKWETEYRIKKIKREEKQNGVRKTRELRSAE